MLRLRDAVFSISIANLAYFSIYALLQAQKAQFNQYYIKVPPQAIDYAALLLNIFLVAAITFLLIRYARKRQDRGSRAIVLAWTAGLCATIIVGLLRAAGILSTTALQPLLQNRGAVAAGVLMAIIGVFLVVRFTSKVIALFRFLFFALVPFAALSIGVIALHLFRRVLPYPDRTPAPRHAPASAVPHVVLMIFDEGDYRLMFTERPSRIRLSSFDRMRRESLFAENAYPPANVTDFSIPSLTTGLMLRTAFVQVHDDLLLLPRDTPGQATTWRSVPTMFTDAQSLGATTGLVGWSHPYGRITGDHVQDCYWYEVPSQTISMQQGNLFSRMLLQTRTLFETPRLSLFGRSLVVQTAVARHEAMTDDAVEMLKSKQHNFDFLHFAIPHSPHIFDARKGTLSLENDRFAGYVDNLALADIVLGELREVMERNGTWDDSIVIITSDHWCRYATKIDGRRDHRVPFMVKMPHQTAQVPYTRPFNTVALRALIGSLMKKQITSATEVSAWLDANAPMTPPTEAPGFD